uniref:Uncharacterized protein n=1 Tax=Oryza glumipatula TaxID=40148 RepID=A0A0D9Z8B0_9ORYZ
MAAEKHPKTCVFPVYCGDRIYQTLYGVQKKYFYNPWSCLPAFLIVDIIAPPNYYRPHTSSVCSRTRHPRPELLLGALPALSPVGGHDEDVILQQRPRPRAAVRRVRHHRLAGEGAGVGAGQGLGAGGVKDGLVEEGPGADERVLVVLQHVVGVGRGGGAPAGRDEGAADGGEREAARGGGGGGVLGEDAAGGEEVEEALEDGERGHKKKTREDRQTWKKKKNEEEAAAELLFPLFLNKASCSKTFLFPSVYSLPDVVLVYWRCREVGICVSCRPSVCAVLFHPLKQQMHAHIAAFVQICVLVC